MSDTTSSSRRRAAASDDGGDDGEDKPVDKGHIVDTLVSTVPAAILYASDRRFQKGFGNLVPFVPAAVASIENANNKEKQDVRLFLGDALIAIAPVLLARVLK